MLKFIFAGNNMYLNGVHQISVKNFGVGVNLKWPYSIALSSFLHTCLVGIIIGQVGQVGQLGGSGSQLDHG
jgi:hypothetical protein